MDRYLSNNCLLGRTPKTGAHFTCQPHMCGSCGFNCIVAAERMRLIMTGKLTTGEDGLQRLIIHKTSEERPTTFEKE